MKQLVLHPVTLCIVSAFSFFAAPLVSATGQPLVNGQTVSTPATHPLDSIRTAVEEFIATAHSPDQQLEIVVKPLDKRLRLTHCETELAPTWSHGSRQLGRVTVQVACSSPKPWRVHVQASVTMEGSVWTLTRSAQRGDVLGQDMLLKQQVKLGANNAAFNSLGTPIVDISRWLGFEFTQRVSAGKVLNERMLKPARMIGKGDTVVIRHRSQGLELSTRGVALSDAEARSQTQVRNSSSGKIIDVVVVSPGTVEILQ